MIHIHPFCTLDCRRCGWRRLGPQVFPFGADFQSHEVPHFVSRKLDGSILEAHVGTLIGKGGEAIRMMTSEAGCNIQIVGSLRKKRNCFGSLILSRLL